MSCNNVIFSIQNVSGYVKVLCIKDGLSQKLLQPFQTSLVSYNIRYIRELVYTHAKSFRQILNKFFIL